MKNKDTKSVDVKYFPHQVHTRDDEKVQRLMMKHGSTGYGLMWMLYEDLYKSKNSMDLDFDLLSYNYRADVDILKSVILESDLFVVDESENKFGSIAVQAYINKMNLSIKYGKIGAKKSWESEKRVKSKNLDNQKNTKSTTSGKPHEQRDEIPPLEGAYTPPIDPPIPYKEKESKIKERESKVKENNNKRDSYVSGASPATELSPQLKLLFEQCKLSTPARTYEKHIFGSRARDSEIELMIKFAYFHKNYPGTKMGYLVGLEKYKKICKKMGINEIETCKELYKGLAGQKKARERLQEIKDSGKDVHIAPWKNMSTYINNMSWEEEIPVPEESKKEDPRKNYIDTYEY